MPPQGPRYAFSTDDLSVYERIDPDQFPDYDDADSVVVEAVISGNDGDQQ